MGKHLLIEKMNSVMLFFMVRHSIRPENHFCFDSNRCNTMVIILPSFPHFRSTRKNGVFQCKKRGLKFIVGQWHFHLNHLTSRK